MPGLLLVDDEEVFRAPLAEALRMQGFEVREASTAPAALESALRNRPDLVLLDVIMPNIDGFELLRYFRARALYRTLPVILLSAVVRKDYLAKAASLGVKDYLLKSSFSIETLCERILARIGAPLPNVHFQFPLKSTLPEPPRSATAAPARVSTASELLAHVELKAFPSTVAEVLALAADPHASLAGIEGVLQRDPVLSTKVMVAANSPGFLRGASCTTIQDALRTLGLTQVVAVVSAGAVLSPSDLASPWGYDLRRLWVHSLAAGIVGQRLQEPKDEAYGFLLGLMHDLPSLLCLSCLGPTWEQVRGGVFPEGATLATRLGLVFGLDFSELASEVFQRLRVPDILSRPLLEHHAAFQGGTHRVEPGRQARIVEIAHQMACVLGRTGGGHQAIAPIPSDQMRLIHEPATLAHDLIPLDQRIAVWENMSGSVMEPESALAWEHQRILFWRGEGWTIPDPFETLLQRHGAVIRVETFGELTANADLKVVLAEPGSAEWEWSGQLKGLVMLIHVGAASVPAPKTVRTLRLPATDDQISRLMHSL